MIHVFIGTKAQYIKTAPLLWLMDERGIDYRLIDSGQHAVLAASFQEEMGIRAPDVRLGKQADITSVPQAIVWALRLARRLLSRSRLRRAVFGGSGGICVVHGDTPSTFLSMLMARRAGLAVAHLEAGLSSERRFHPFPEEMIRRLVARRADLLFAPDHQAVCNLESMRLKGRIIPLPGNTVLEALRRAAPVAEDSGPAIITMHRVENLHRKARRQGLASVAEQMAATREVRWLLHQPTRTALGQATIDRLGAAGVRMTELVGHSEFLNLLAAAPFVITDGGSIQEECAVLGVPTLLWRKHTDRPDGVGANVLLSRYDLPTVQGFLKNPEWFRRPIRIPEVSPSVQILEVLSEWR